MLQKQQVPIGGLQAAFRQTASVSLSGSLLQAPPSNSMDVKASSSFRSKDEGK